MKYILFILLLLPAVSKAQKQYIAAKSYTIEMACFVQGVDTFCSLSFRDGRYTVYKKFESVHFTKSAALDFADALIELSKDKYAADESSKTVNGVMILKGKMMGAPYLRLSHNGAFANFVNMKQSTKFADGIYDFFGIN